MFNKGDLVEIDCFGYKGMAIITGQTFPASDKHWSFQPLDRCYVPPNDCWALFKYIKLLQGVDDS